MPRASARDSVDGGTTSGIQTPFPAHISIELMVTPRGTELAASMCAPPMLPLYLIRKPNVERRTTGKRETHCTTPKHVVRQIRLIICAIQAGHGRTAGGRHTRMLLLFKYCRAKDRMWTISRTKTASLRISIVPRST